MLVLASASPRRKELLKKMGINFTVTPSRFDEKNDKNLPPEQYALYCAEGKAEEVFTRIGGVVLGVDTVVAVKSEILGKPKDDEQARDMLKKLCGKKHYVISAFCLINNGIKLKAYDKTELFIKKLTDDEIDDYIKSGSPLDKAGAYGIQDELISKNVKYIIGSKDNVIGLPTELLAKVLSCQT